METKTKAASDRHVLVAEDERVTAILIRFALERAGFEVTLATTGVEAWRLVQERNFDLLITDHQMPGISGEELCRRIRTIDTRSDLPIIVLSAKALELDRARLTKDLGVHAVLFKPFDRKDLVEVIERIPDIQGIGLDSHPRSEGRDHLRRPYFLGTARD